MGRICREKSISLVSEPKAIEVKSRCAPAIKHRLCTARTTHLRLSTLAKTFVPQQLKVCIPGDRSILAGKDSAAGCESFRDSNHRRRLAYLSSSQILPQLEPLQRQSKCASHTFRSACSGASTTQLEHYGYHSLFAGSANWSLSKRNSGQQPRRGER